MLLPNYDAWRLASPPEDDGPPDSPLAARLLDAGYSWDGGEFFRIASQRIRRARRPHHGLTVGQRYVETVTIYVDEAGRSRRERAVRGVRS